MPARLFRTLRAAASAAMLLMLGGCYVYPADQYYGGYGYGAGPGVVAPYAPPPLIAETYGPPPIVGDIWIGGFWGWDGGRHRWTPGHWEHPRPGYRWVPHRWDRGPRGWEQHGGHWERH